MRHREDQRFRGSCGLVSERLHSQPVFLPYCWCPGPQSTATLLGVLARYSMPTDPGGGLLNYRGGRLRSRAART